MKFFILILFIISFSLYSAEKTSILFEKCEQGIHESLKIIPEVYNLKDSFSQIAPGCKRYKGKTLNAVCEYSVRESFGYFDYEVKDKLSALQQKAYENCLIN